MGESFVVPVRAAVNVDLTGRSALVTGVASGIGRACAESYREGYAHGASDKTSRRARGGRRACGVPLHPGGVVYYRSLPDHGRRGDRPMVNERTLEIGEERGKV